MKNYKTTLFGLIAAIAQVLIPLAQTGHITLQQAIQASCMAALGFFAKDFNITGNPPVPIQPPVKAE